MPYLSLLLFAFLYFYGSVSCFTVESYKLRGIVRYVDMYRKCDPRIKASIYELAS